MAWKTLDDIELAGKNVLVRVDLNVPVDNGAVTDTTRIERIAPTVQDILAKSGKPILLPRVSTATTTASLCLRIRSADCPQEANPYRHR